MTNAHRLAEFETSRAVPREKARRKRLESQSAAEIPESLGLTIPQSLLLRADQLIE